PCMSALRNDAFAVPRHSAMKPASFESNLARLEAIASELAREDLPLDQALALFEEGIVCLKEATGVLAAAEGKVRELVERADATAAGLAMVPLAARAAAEAARALGLDDRRRSEVVRTLMQAAGAGGMIGGQLLDLEGEGRALSAEELERVHRLKTGALIRASV